MIFNKLFEEQFWIYNVLTNNLLEDAFFSLRQNNEITHENINEKIIFLVQELFKELK
jgi:hypothetical protein